MKKKIIIISIAIFVSSVVYLFAAHSYIYKRISDAELKSPDTKSEYIIGSGENIGANFIYTALGDSLTSGVGVLNYEDSYPYLLAEKLSVNRGNVILRDRAFSGAKTSGLVRNLLTAAVNDQPDMVTLLIGINDIHGRVPKAEFAENYAEILKRLKQGTRAKIFAISIPYIGTDALFPPPYNLYYKYETIEYNKIIRQLAQANNVKYVDLFSPTERMFENTAFCSSDLFHPSAEGYGLWAEIIYANLNN